MARAVFFGTPKFGVPTLEALTTHHQVDAVVTQPDRYAGRGRRRLRVSPVKKAAQDRGLRVLQPSSLRRDDEAFEALCQANADVYVIAAYGQILPPRILSIPPHGCIGVHASLLPKLRGASPIATAILQGEGDTGVTLMLTEAGMDTGPVIAQRRLPIATSDTTETLSDKLSLLGARLLIDTLPDWLAGRIEPRAQDEAQATYAPLIRREAAAIDWGKAAVKIDRQVRAFDPWPGAFSSWDGQDLRVLRARPLPGWRGEALPGTVVRAGIDIGVATGEGLLLLDEVQLAGKRPMSAQQFAMGRRTFVGSILQ
jgi:methionyl-tRNA formyltransferase